MTLRIRFLLNALNSVSEVALVGAFLIASLIGRPGALANPELVGDQPPPPDGTHVAAAVELGHAIFADKTLSNPAGQACHSCHYPPDGFTSPRSKLNSASGIMPGAVTGRFGNRKPPTLSYVAFVPQGPPEFDSAIGAYAGGLFWDGRAPTIETQIPFPFSNPDEMNGFLHPGDPTLIVSKVTTATYAPLFDKAFGAAALSGPPAQIFDFVCDALAAFLESSKVSPFDSQYDAVLVGQAQFTPTQLAGLQLFTGSVTGRPGGAPNYKSAKCVFCHTIPETQTVGADLFTNSGFFNVGVPKNSKNPFYKETDSTSNPLGYNPLGEDYIDYGLGDFIYTNLGLPAGNDGIGSNGQGDYLAINGTFKTPTLRNVDKRHDATFVKCYGHNGYFKSLADFVHFYNTRNLTTVPGEVINFTLANPYKKLKGTPLWPKPEYGSPTTLINPTGALGGVGNLGLTADEESAIVDFLETLSDST